MPSRSAVAIRWARQDAGLSQAALAQQLGVTQQAVAKVEHPDANPTLNTLLRVAAALGMSLSLDRLPGAAAVAPCRAGRRVCADPAEPRPGGRPAVDAREEVPT